MIEGAKWRRWVFFYVPVTAFVVALLFPFYWMIITTIRPDRELYRPWSAPNYAPFWTTNPTLEHIRSLLTETLFSTWMLNTMLISIAATAISLFCGLLAGYALSRLKFPFAGLIGTGIFILTGVAAQSRTGPALMLSFVVAGLACVFAALCYAEFASMVPVAGSAYTYAYATLGELFAWIIGWDLILEYAVGSATVAHGWSAHFQEFIPIFHEGLAWKIGMNS